MCDQLDVRGVPYGKFHGPRPLRRDVHWLAQGTGVAHTNFSSTICFTTTSPKWQLSEN